MVDKIIPNLARSDGHGVAALGTAASLVALLSAATCCVLPLALAGLGIGVGGLATLVPYRLPLTLVAFIVVAAGWLLFLRNQRVSATECGTVFRSRVMLTMLCFASVVVAISSLWAFIEQPLVRALGGA